MHRLKRDTWVVLCILAVFALGVWAYWPGLTAPFQFDSEALVLRNPEIQDLSRPGDIWRLNAKRFLSQLTLALDFSVHGSDVVGFHATNLLIHALTSVLLGFFVWYLCKKRQIPNSQWVGVIAGALFWIHPVQTQAVTYIWQRSVGLATLFFVAALFCHACFRFSGRRLCLIGAWSCAFLAMFCKEISFTLPFVLLAMDVLLFDQSWRTAWRYWIAYGCLVPIIPVLFLMDWDAHLVSLHMEQGVSLYTPLTYWLTQLSQLPSWLRLGAFPTGQHLDYDVTPIAGLLDPAWFLGGVIAVAWMGLIAWFWRRQPLISFLGLLVCGGLAVEMGTYLLPDLFFEHRLYLPMAGATALVALLASKTPQKWMPVFAVIVCAFAWLTHQRNLVWQSRVDLWAESFRFAPQKPRVMANYATALFESGDSKRAEELLRSACALEPAHPDYASKLGLVLLGLGENFEALYWFDKSLALDGNQAHVFNHRAGLFIQMKQWSRALADVKRAIDLNPNLPSAWQNQGVVQSMLQMTDAAIASFQVAIKLDPKAHEPHTNLGAVYYRQGKRDLAKRHFEASIAIEPEQAKILETLAVMYSDEQKPELALDHLNRAIALEPKRASAYLNRGIVLTKVKRFKDAILDLDHYLSLHASGAGFLHRGLAYYYLGDLGSATRDLSYAIQDGQRVPQEVRNALHLP